MTQWIGHYYDGLSHYPHIFLILNYTLVSVAFPSSSSLIYGLVQLVLYALVRVLLYYGAGL